MNCPHCALPIAPPQDHCGSCGFHDAALATYLGADWVRLERITDTADCLRLEESRELEVRLDDFERQFPQGFAAFYFGALPPKLNPLELGMWLLNHGAFSTQQFTKRNEFGFVCVVDPLAGRHGIAVGYALEKILSAPVFQQLLGSMTPLLRTGRWAEASSTVLDQLSEYLRARGRCSHRRLDMRPPPGRSGNPVDYGFEPLRSGHRKNEGAKSSERSSTLGKT